MNSLCRWMIAAALLLCLGMACGGDGEKVLPASTLPVPAPSEVIPLPTPTPSEVPLATAATAPTSGGLTQHSFLDAESQDGGDTGGRS